MSLRDHPPGTVETACLHAAQDRAGTMAQARPRKPPEASRRSPPPTVPAPRPIVSRRPSTARQAWAQHAARGRWQRRRFGPRRARCGQPGAPCPLMVCRQTTAGPWIGRIQPDIRPFAGERAIEEFVRALSTPIAPHPAPVGPFVFASPPLKGLLRNPLPRSGSLNYRSERVRGRGTPVTTLSHGAAFLSNEGAARSNPGIM